MATNADQPDPPATPPIPLTWRNYLTLALLLAVAALSYIDRQIFTLFQDDIKEELGLSDSQLGLLTGLSFALFYAVVAFPVARYADRGDRRKVIAISVIVWSAATALCGIARSFWTLMLARIFLASGEAGAGPASNSLLVEVFPPHRRVLVISLMLAASSVGISGGLMLGGWLSQWYDWREVFLIVGLPGILLGVLVLLFVQEPRRDDTAAVTAARGADAIPVREVLRTMLGNPSLRWVMVLLSMVPITGFALILWGPSFFQRVHGMDKEATGLWLGGAMLAGLVVGNILAGLLGDKYGTANPRFNGWLAGAGLLIAFPFALLFSWTESANIALLAFVVVKFMMTLHLGPIIALSFAQVPVRMRATTSATINMFIGLAGTGLGGTLAGVLSQAYEPAWGELSLRPALATLSCCLVIGGGAAIMAGRSARALDDET